MGMIVPIITYRSSAGVLYSPRKQTSLVSEGSNPDRVKSVTRILSSLKQAAIDGDASVGPAV